jgi:predicted phage baseplate assembly protein
MSTCGCPVGCGEPPIRRPIGNPAGLYRIDYRVGDFATFRRMLEQHRAGEAELAPWQPTAGSDLGLQLLDWWAYIADVLTFYNERIANEDYLRTAVLDADVHHLVGLLGYRPRPGIGARGTLAAIAAEPDPLLIPSGFAVASKATPGLESQTFETTNAVTFEQPTSVSSPRRDDVDAVAPAGGPPPSAPPGTAEAPPHDRLIAHGGVLLEGTPTSIRRAERLLLISTSWASVTDPAVVVTVSGTSPERDPHGRRNTRVLLSDTSSVPAAAKAADFRLLRATRTAHLASLPAGATVIGPGLLVLDAPARYLTVGDPLVVAGPARVDVVRVESYAEQIWYANAAAGHPTQPPDGAPGIPLVVAVLTISSRPGNQLSGAAPSTTTALTGWTPVGTLLDTPVAGMAALPPTLTLAAPPDAAPGEKHAALIEDATGVGAAVTVTPSPGSADVAVARAGPRAADRPLQAPLRILWDLIEVSRGSTVRDEQLGVGDATAAGQDFVLAGSPVTYLTDAPGRSGDGWSSTVVLTVGDRYWTEVPSLYGRGPDEAVFETYEDDRNRTHVRTGTGQAGRRLPTGAPVAASYRVGAGAAVPPVGALTQVLTAVPNLRSVRNPAPPSGGADPEPATRIRRLAPRSVLTFGRAISGDDYATVAAAAPGVSRAAVAWEWDPAEQRPLVRVYVGDDDAALVAARRALADQADPNRPVAVVRAVPHPIALTLTLLLDRSYVPSDIVTQVRQVLLAPPDGLFAPGVLALGEPLYRSRIEQVVYAIPGVTATHRLLVGDRPGRSDTPVRTDGPRFDPGPGGFFTLSTDDLDVSGVSDA